MSKRLILTLALLALLAAACGDDGAGPFATTSSAAGGTTAAEQTTAAPSEGDLACDALVGLDEAAALFGEPAVFDTEASQSMSGLEAASCVWTSVEDPSNTQDFQSHLLQVQVYRGAQFYAPEMAYSDVEPIPGIGDQAFFSPQLGVSTGFIDGDWVAFVTYSVIGMGDAPDSSAKKEQVIDLLRLVHDRIL